MTEHEKYMAMAIEESRKGLRAGALPFGSVIVRDGDVIGRAYNTSEEDHDPTAHAETAAIRDAGARLKTTNLNGSTLYTSCEPCPMCCGAILSAGIGAVVIASRGETVRALRGEALQREYRPDRLARMVNADLDVTWDVLRDEAEAVLKNYQGWRD